MPSDRCPTSSGPHRCSKLSGHDGECETVAPSTPWVGPAARAAPRARHGQSVALSANIMAFAGTRMPQERVSTREAPSAPSEAGEAT